MGSTLVPQTLFGNIPFTCKIQYNQLSLQYVRKNRVLVRFLPRKSASFAFYMISTEGDGRTGKWGNLPLFCTGASPTGLFMWDKIVAAMPVPSLWFMTPCARPQQGWATEVKTKPRPHQWVNGAVCLPWCGAWLLEASQKGGACCLCWEGGHRWRPSRSVAVALVCVFSFQLKGL